jgi:O-antigen/teichoic acid export membrane protein
MSSYSSKAFKRSTLHYIGGRIANALIAFFVFVWVARYLPAQEYASYVAAFACLELGLIFFGFGMEWVTAVHVPEVKLKASGRILSRFVWSCATIQSAMLLVGASIFGIMAHQLALWLGLANAGSVFQLYAVVMFVEGLGRVFRDQLLSCLLLQGAAQASQFARNIAMLAFALLLPSTPHWQTANGLALAEMLASSISLLLSISMLAIALHRMRDNPGRRAQWIPPPWRQLLVAGRNAWISNISNLTWSGQAVVLIVARFAGPEFTAALGFARNMAEQIRRYLPMEFLLGIVRTLLISRFVLDQDKHRLALRTGILYRVNLLFLLPLMCVAVLNGVELCAMVSKGRYASANWLLVGWLVILVFWAHHRITDLMAHALSRSELTSSTSIRLLATPVLMVIAAYLEAWSMIFLILAGTELAYSWIVLARLKIYRPNYVALSKVAGATFVAAVVIGLPFWGHGVTTILLQLATAFGIVVGLAVLLRAWTREEAESVLGALKAHSIPT